MIYGFCAEFLKNTYQYRNVKKIRWTAADWDLFDLMMHERQLRMVNTMQFNVNVRVADDPLQYYTTDLVMAYDSDHIYIDDEFELVALDLVTLDKLGIDHYTIDTCGWNSFYSNEKDYYNLRLFDINAYMKGGTTCRGD